MNIKKMLKDGAKQVLPDEKVKEEIKYRMGIDDTDGEAELGGIKAKISRNKKIFAITACALAAVIVLCAFIPLMLRRNSGPNNHPDGIFGELSASEQIYGISAASAGMMISGIGSSSSVQTIAAGGNAVAACSSPLKYVYSEEVSDEEVIKTINEYMSVVESFISEDSFSVTGGTNADGAYGDYAYVMRVTYTGLSGDTRDSGTIYYNRTLTETEQDGDETESTYAIQGVMILEGTAYPLFGEHQTESEEDESEEEYEMTISLGDGLYMRVYQEIKLETETGKPAEKEIEYSYILYRGNADDDIDDDLDIDDFEDYDDEGDILSVTTFKFEQEEDETELVMQIWERGTTQIFAFWQEDGEIKISVGGASSVATYTVKIIDGRYVYFRGDTEIDFDD